MKYDVIIVGAGPAGIFAALELSNTNKKILLLDKGKLIEKRVCPKRKTGICVGCKPCHITAGFSGAGAFSDGKLTLTSDVGGTLSEYYDDMESLIKYVDDIYLKYGADPKVFTGNGVTKKIRANAIKCDLKLIESPIRHIGTEKSFDLFSKIQKTLEERGIEMKFSNPVKDLIIDSNTIKGVIADKKYYSDKILMSVGREGADWLKETLQKYKVRTEVGVVDIGVRVEVRNEIMQEINDALYEGKFIYYTPTFDDKVRTFCQNPSGVVAAEHYDELETVNGHSYKDAKLKTENTNFALLVSNSFTEPFNDPIKYGKYVAQLGNMLSGGRVMVQRFGDFKRGRRTTKERLKRNNVRPTLKDAVPGDLSLVLPYRIMKDIEEMLLAMNKIAPGLSSDETLLYGVEVKFYSNKVKVNNKFESSVKGLYVAGDGAGITRGLIQASANGVLIGRYL